MTTATNTATATTAAKPTLQTTYHYVSVSPINTVTATVTFTQQLSDNEFVADFSRVDDDVEWTVHMRDIPVQRLPQTSPYDAATFAVTIPTFDGAFADIYRSEFRSFFARSDTDTDNDGATNVAIFHLADVSADTVR